MNLNTTTPAITRELRIYDYLPTAWGERYSECPGSQEHCINCGRRTSPKRKALGVIVSGGGCTILHPDDDTTEQQDPGYMGWFAVGSECIKKVPAAYRVELPA